jgi:hypothetical protein
VSARYHVYTNDGAGGPIDYDTPVGDTDQLSFLTSVLGQPSDNRFGVRAYDDVTGHEELNADAVVRIVVDGDGVDITLQPAAPIALRARAVADGTVKVSWSYDPAAPGGLPTGFRVWVTLGTVVNFGNPPAATLAFLGPVYHEVEVESLTDGATYAVGVRAYNAAAEEPNTNQVLVVADATGPDPVDDLAGTTA